MPAARVSHNLRQVARVLAALAVAYTGVLLFATHHPNPEGLLGPDPPSDKTLHLVAYGILGLLVAAALATAGRRSLRSVAVAGAALAAFAAADEATQPLFRRQADPLDWVFDCLGLAAGFAAVAAAGWLLARRPGGRRRPAGGQ